MKIHAGPTLPKWFRIRAGAKTSDPVEILIHGTIGGPSWYEDSISEAQITAALADIPAGTPIVVGINSQGGSVGDGLAIYNALRRRGKDVTTRIDGYALSIASVVALAGSRIVSPKASVWMIHEPWSLTQGNAEEHRRSAEMLEVHAETLVSIYAEHTSQSRKAVRQAMKDETWFRGEDAKAWGLATDNTDDPVDLKELQPAAFKKVPAFARSRPAVGAQPHNTPQPPHDPMKDKVLALLKKHGITINDQWTDSDLVDQLNALVAANKVTAAEAKAAQAGPAAPPATAPSPANVVSAEEFRALQAQMQAERTRRISAEVDGLLAERGSLNLDRADWLARALKDESILDAIRALPVDAAAPIRAGRPQIDNRGNPLLEAYNRLEPGAARASFRVRNHTALIEARERFLPQANTLAAGLVNDYMADGLIVVLGTKLAPLNAFSTSFNLDRLAPRRSVDVPKASAGSTTATNPTNFEAGNTTLDVVTVTVNQYSQSFHLPNNAYNQGYQMQHLAEINAMALANSISDVYTALMIAGNFGAATVIGAAASFDSADLSPIMALAKNYRRKCLLLDGGHLAYLLPSDKTHFRIGEAGAYGFDLIAEQNRWTGGVANLAGFVCDPGAIAVAAGLPKELPSGEFLSMTTTTLQQGLSVQSCTWFSKASRTHWASYDVMFGAAVGDGTAAENLVTA